MQGKLRPDLIASLYAAALEDDVLVHVSRIVREAMDVDSTTMYLHAQGELLAFEATQDLHESRDDYLAYYYRLDPWKGGRHALINQAFIGTEVISDRDLLATEFYNDFSVHYGIRRPLGINLEIEPGVTATFGVNRIASKRLMTEADKETVNELGFHVRAALRLHRRHVRDRTDAAWQPAALDALQFGAVICSSDGRVSYANRAALALERQRAGIVIDARNGVQAASAAETDALGQLIRRAAAGTPGAMRLTGQDGGLSVLATPLAAGGPFLLKSWAVLLSLRRVDATLSLDADLLRQLFALSPNQTALCFQLAAGLTFEEAAAARGTALPTARAHFREILAKTRTRNLRDLLRLLASLPQIGP